MSSLRAFAKRVGAHFEVGFYVYLWLNASVLAALVGRAWLGTVGLVTVVPFVVIYAARRRRRDER